MTILTIQQINLAIDINRNLVQLTTKNLDKVFFMLEEDYIEKNIKVLMQHGFYHSSFDNEVFRFYVNRRWAHGLSEKEFKRRSLAAGIEQFVAMTEYGAVISESQEEFYSVPWCIGNMDGLGKENHFVPEHFPKGTLVTVSRIMRGMNRDELQPSVYVIDHVVQNGPNSFCVKTTTPESEFWKKQYGDQNAKHGFNISHVDKILMRGDGELKIVDSRNRGNWDVSYYDESSRLPELARKNHWLTWNMQSIVGALAGKPTQRGSYYDTTRLASQMENCSFVKESFTPMFDLLLINKKRAKRFISQNKNRFLVSAAAMQKEEDYSWHSKQDPNFGMDDDDLESVVEPDGKEDDSVSSFARHAEDSDYYFSLLDPYDGSDD